MKITVKLFASLRERVGFSETEMEVFEGETLRDVWARVADKAAHTGEILMAVNMDYANPDTLLRDGDEVAFFPPVTGG